MVQDCERPYSHMVFGYVKLAVTDRFHLFQTASREWKNSLFNFDNIGQALLSLFVTATLNGYAGIMDAAMASGDKDSQPVALQNWGALFFFVAFVVVVAYTLMNLYIGMSCLSHGLFQSPCLLGMLAPYAACLMHEMSHALLLLRFTRALHQHSGNTHNIVCAQPAR